jgi:hypothetical protein
VNDLVRDAAKRQGRFASVHPIPLMAPLGRYGRITPAPHLGEVCPELAALGKYCHRPLRPKRPAKGANPKIPGAHFLRIRALVAR